MAMLCLSILLSACLRVTFIFCKRMYIIDLLYRINTNLRTLYGSPIFLHYTHHNSLERACRRLNFDNKGEVCAEVHHVAINLCGLCL